MKKVSEPSSRRKVMKGLVAGVGSVAMTVPITKAMASPAAEVEKLNAPDLLVTQFGARGDGSADDTLAFERAISAAAEKGQRLRIPAGRYLITRTLMITRGLRLEGDGVERTILLGAVIGAGPVIHIYAKPTDSIMGPVISGFGLDCGHGKTPCDGIRLTTGGKGAALHQAVIRDLFLINVATGLYLSGVVYRCIFDNITITRSISRYGVYCDENFEDVTYNSFSNIEVTNVENGAHAFWVHSNYSNFSNLTCDGCCYFSSPGGTMRNLAIEGVTATRPPSMTLIRFNQIQAVQGINLINIDPRRCACGIQVIGQAVVLQAIRCYGRQPSRLFDLHVDSEGAIIGVQTDHAPDRLETYTTHATLQRWSIQAAQALVGAAI